MYAQILSRKPVKTKSRPSQQKAILTLLIITEVYQGPVFRLPDAKPAHRECSKPKG